MERFWLHLGGAFAGFAGKRRLRGEPKLLAWSMAGV